MIIIDDTRSNYFSGETLSATPRKVIRCGCFKVQFIQVAKTTEMVIYIYRDSRRQTILHCFANGNDRIVSVQHIRRDKSVLTLCTDNSYRNILLFQQLN